MGQLTEQIENLYTNNYLLKINNRFQSFVDDIDHWDASPVLLQKNLFGHCVQPFLQKDKKVCVIISDAMPLSIRRSICLSHSFFEEWIDLLMQSIGFNPEKFGTRSKLAQLIRLIPFCERNYNLIELGPKGTGKSHIYSEFSPHGTLVSGGDAT